MKALKPSNNLNVSDIEIVGYTIKCYNLKTNKDIDLYNSFLENFKGLDTLYKTELFNAKNSDLEQLKFFVLSKMEEVIVLMPFSLRKIIINNSDTTFFDTSSLYGYSGPLFKDSILDVDLQNFWNLVDSWYSQNRVVSEFIRFNLDGNCKKYSGILTPTLNNVKGIINKDEEEQWKTFPSKVRNNYRKAQCNELKATIYHKNIPEVVIEAFHTIYISTMERNDAESNYFFSLEYFKNLIHSNPEGNALILISKNGISISTELILLNKNTMFSFLGGTIADYFEFRPNDFLKIEAMHWGRLNGYTNYILGGGRTNDDSLYKYKKSFFPSNTDVIFNTGRKIINERIYAELTSQILNFEYQIDDSDIKNNFFPLYRKKPHNQPMFQVVEDKNEWKKILAEIKIYDFYHTYDYHILSKQELEKAILLSYTNNGMHIAFPLLIRKIPNTNYYDATSVYGYGGPISSDKIDPTLFMEFMQLAIDYFKKENIISIYSSLNPYIKNQENILKTYGEIKILGTLVNIDLTLGDEKSRAAYSKSTKSRVNKARRQCYVRKVESQEDLETFISIYHENMTRLDAKSSYFFSRDYFISFTESNDINLDILLVCDTATNEVMAASMFVKTGEIIQFHLSGTRNKFLNIAPARVFLDEMRLLGIAENFRYFNLGGGLGGQKDSLFEFKSSFSNDYKEFKAWNFIVDKDKYDELCALKLGDENHSDENFFPLYRI